MFAKQKNTGIWTLAMFVQKLHSVIWGIEAIQLYSNVYLTPYVGLRLTSIFFFFLRLCPFLVD